MIRKFAMGLVLAVVAGLGILQRVEAQRVQSQQNQTQPDPTQSNQTPQNQSGPPQTTPAQPSTPAQTQEASSSSQEASDDELGRRRKGKAHDYKNWTYNIQVGANLPRSTTKTFVKGGGGLGGVGVARNFSKYFGFRLDAQYVNLPLRTSALQLAQAPSASNHVYAFTLDPVFSLPVTEKYSGYFLIGPSYYHRSGKLDSSTALPGSPCNSFYNWWGTCFALSLPINGNFLHESQNEFGYNFGGGVARKINSKFDVFAEYRQQHGSRNNITTDWRSLTLGLRW